MRPHGDLRAVVTDAVLFLALALASGALRAQSPQIVRGPDERRKADILVVVAHPDDEAGVTPYLARAIYDLHKRVAVVFATRGGSGGNDYSREHGPALANIREMEAREACAKLGITNVWFLDGKDTASQNVLNSLANWGQGSNLEKLVGLFRLTQPEIVITWLPSVFIGENHGDHQAAGVLATEAFDLSGNPVVFPAQVAGASKRLEPYLENLTPWQAQKIYYFSDANDSKQFAGKGPAYSVKEISPSQKRPYWRIALDAAKPHLTQFPADIERISKLSDAQLEKMMDDPNAAWWSEPMTLIFGKASRSYHGNGRCLRQHRETWCGDVASPACNKGFRHKALRQRTPSAWEARGDTMRRFAWNTAWSICPSRRSQRSPSSRTHPYTFRLSFTTPTRRRSAYR